jgi:succinyl-CoA synthetase beta subunit
LVALDALVSYGLKPANYTEFSGNPPAWKVKRLAEIVMSKEGLRGLVLVGGKANFTDQMETLSGFAEALREIKPEYPIVVRRDGPRMAEAKKMLESLASELGLEMVVHDAETPIVEAIGKLEKMVDK